MEFPEFSAWLKTKVKDGSGPEWRVPRLSVEEWLLVRREVTDWMTQVGIRSEEVARLIGASDQHFRLFLRGRPGRPVYPLSRRLLLRLLEVMSRVTEPLKPWRPVAIEQFEPGRKYIPEDRVLVPPVACPLCEEAAKQGRIKPEEVYWWLPKGTKYCPGHRSEARRRSRWASRLAAAEQRLSLSGEMGFSSSGPTG
jgi:hypothetical protein